MIDSIISAALTCAAFVPDIAQCAPLTFLIISLIARPLAKRALPFYVACVVLVVIANIPGLLNLAAPFFPRATMASMKAASAWLSNNVALAAFFKLTTSACVGVWIYIIVMFVGVLPKTPWVKTMLRARSELSVLGGIIICAHLLKVLAFPFFFLNPMFRNVWGVPSVYFMFIATVLIGIVLTVCFLVPWITSFRCVRRQMDPQKWKRIQKLAYPFMFLMLAQGIFLGLGHTFYGWPFTQAAGGMRILGTPSTFLLDTARYVAQTWIYTCLMIAYGIALYHKKRTTLPAAKKIKPGSTPERY